MAASHEAFDTSAKVDPNRVVTSIKDTGRGKDFREVTIVNGAAAEGFTPMQWPLFDDGKPVSTNAMGYEIGGYFKRHQEALRAAKAEAERKEQEERAAAEKAAAEAKEAEEERNTVSLEELEAIRNAARNEGYTEGLNQGHEEGYQKGVEQGKTDGFAQGQQDGMAQGYQDGFRQGRDDGFTKGQEAGIASGSDMVTTQADRFRHLADMLAHPLREMDETVTDEIVYLVSRLVKVIIKREIKGDTEFLKHAIEQCVSLLPEAKQGAEIQLSENDYALMVAAIGKDYMNSQGWNLSTNPDLEEGDIIVNTKVSSVQWRVNDRIDALISDFLTGASDVVSSARKESIEGCPEYDEVPKKQIIPPRDILAMSERIAANMQSMAPKPNFKEELAANAAAAAADAAQATAADRPVFDPDAAELQAATNISKTNEAIAEAIGQSKQGDGDAAAADSAAAAAAGDSAEPVAEVAETILPGQLTPPPSIADQAAAAEAEAAAAAAAQAQ